MKMRPAQNIRPPLPNVPFVVIVIVITIITNTLLCPS